MKIISMTALLMILMGNANAQTQPVSIQANLVTFANHLHEYITSNTSSNCKFEESDPFCPVKPVKRSGSNKIICEAVKVPITVDCGDGSKSIQFGWESVEGQPEVSIDGIPVSVDNENLPTPTLPLSKYLKFNQTEGNPWFAWAFRIAKEHLDLKEKE